MLAVAVDANGQVEAVFERVAEAGLDRAADAEIERQTQDARAGASRDLRRPVV